VLKFHFSTPDFETICVCFKHGRFTVKRLCKPFCSCFVSVPAKKKRSKRFAKSFYCKLKNCPAVSCKYHAEYAGFPFFNRFFRNSADKCFDKTRSDEINKNRKVSRSKSFAAAGFRVKTGKQPFSGFPRNDRRLQPENLSFRGPVLLKRQKMDIFCLFNKIGNPESPVRTVNREVFDLLKVRKEK
jgi:hypothetical protein